MKIGGPGPLENFYKNRPQFFFLDIYKCPKVKSRVPNLKKNLGFLKTLHNALFRQNDFFGMTA